MESTEAVITCDNIHKTYLLGTEGVPALRGVEVDVMSGEFMVVYGASGGGKSTLLNVLGTIDSPTKGNLLLFGKRITDQTPDSELAALRCKQIGFVFQSFNLLSTMTAIENVSLPMLIAGKLSTHQIRQRARKLLEDVGLGNRVHHYPAMLSGGEQQRVTIARALANDPEILFLDEPTGDLDTQNTLLIMNILLTLNRDRGLTMMMVTHDVYMKQYAHRVLYMRDGRVSKVETIPLTVRERAWKELQSSLQDKLVNDAGTTTPTSHWRRPVDYQTFAAQCPFDPAVDEEMTHVVEVLFS